MIRGLQEKSYREEGIDLFCNKGGRTGSNGWKLVKEISYLELRRNFLMEQLTNGTVFLPEFGVLHY